MYRNGASVLQYAYLPSMDVYPSRMNCFSLDTIGIAGFAHDFCALEGKRSSVEEVFTALGTAPPMNMIIMLLGQVVPILRKVPNPHGHIMGDLHDKLEQVAEELLETRRKEKVAGSNATYASRSIIGSLRMSAFSTSYDQTYALRIVKAENADSELNLTPEEALAQVTCTFE